MRRRAAHIMFCLALGVAVLLAVWINRGDRSASAGPAGGYSDEWAARLARRTFNGQHFTALEHELGAAVQDSGIYVHGGTGSNTTYYLLADRVVVVVHLTFQDQIVLEPYVAQVKEWPEAPGGYFTQVPEIIP